MRIRNSLIAFLVMCVLLGALYWVKTGKEKKEKSDEESRKVFLASTDNITAMKIRNKKGEFSLKIFVVTNPKAKDEKVWKILEPVKADGDNSFISGIVSSIGNLSSERAINVTKDQFGEYGLSEPESVLEITYHDKGEKEKSQKISFGSKNPSGENQYIRVGNSDKINLVGTSLDYIKEKTLTDFRKKTIFDFSKDDVIKISAFYPGSRDRFVIEKLQKDYYLLEPIGTKGDESEVTKFINNLTGIRAEDFPSEDFSANPAQWGFAKPYAEIKISLKDNAQENLLIGKEVGEKKGIYLTKTNPKGVVQVKYDLKDDLTLKLSKLVNKKLSEWLTEDIKKIFIKRKKELTEMEKINSKWMLPSFKDYADQSILDNILSKLKNLTADEFVSIKPDKAYGFESPPSLLVTLIRNDGNLAGTLFFGKSLPDNKMFVMSSATNYVYKISSSVSDQITKDLAKIRNKKLSPINRWKIANIKFFNKDGNIYFSKDEKGVFTAKIEGKIVYDVNKKDLKSDVDKILDFLTGDKVENYIGTYDVKLSAKQFDFDNPTARFAVSEMLGEEQTVIFGKKDDEGKSVYAQIIGIKPVYRIKASDLDDILNLFKKDDKPIKQKEETK